MKKLYIKINGMYCSHCESTIKKVLIECNNIKEVIFKNDIAVITYTKKLDLDNIINKINSIGYNTNKNNISNDINTLKDNIKLKEFVTISLVIIILVYLINKIFGYNIFNAIPTINSNITYFMLFLTGILTSIHCISMCGAINLVATTSKSNNLKRPILYNLGRVISYTLIGGIVGLIGSTLQINNYLEGTIIIIASLIMFVMSLNLLGIIKLRKLNIFKIKTTNKSPFIIGLLNGLMPCGPLQAMELYSLSTGSFIKGALSMFIFSLGTVPLMLFMGLIINIFKPKYKIIINKISSVLILLLSLVMLNRGVTALNLNILKSSNNYNDYLKSTLVDNYQVINFNLEYDNYKDIIIQKDIPVKIIINVDKKYLTGCNNKILIDEFNIEKELTIGENIIEFTPNKEETITYTCWMRMIKNKIKVIDDLDYFKGE